MSLSSMTMSRKIVLSRTHVPVVLLVLSCLLLLRLVIRWDPEGLVIFLNNELLMFLVFSLSDSFLLVRSGDPLYTRVEKSQAKSKKVLLSKIQNEPTGTKMQRAKKQDVQVEAIVDDEKREKSSELPLILLWNRYQASRLFCISFYSFV